MSQLDQVHHLLAPENFDEAMEVLNKLGFNWKSGDSTLDPSSLEETRRYFTREPMYLDIDISDKVLMIHEAAEHDEILSMASILRADITVIKNFHEFLDAAEEIANGSFKGEYYQGAPEARNIIDIDLSLFPAEETLAVIEKLTTLHWYSGDTPTGWNPEDYKPGKAKGIIVDETDWDISFRSIPLATTVRSMEARTKDKVVVVTPQTTEELVEALKALVQPDHVPVPEFVRMMQLFGGLH